MINDEEAMQLTNDDNLDNNRNAIATYKDFFLDTNIEDTNIKLLEKYCHLTYLYTYFDIPKYYGYDDLVIDNDELLSKTASLLIHAAKIDEKYTDIEKNIIKQTLLELGVNQSKIDQLVLTAENNEQKSNQILDFTKEIKNTDDKFKIKIIESLWGIIYSNKDADMYETNLMRRLSGLLYLDHKVVGDIKKKMKKKFS